MKLTRALLRTWRKESSHFRLYTVFVPICPVGKYSVCIFLPFPEPIPTLIESTDVLQKRPTTPTLKAHTIAYLNTHTKSFEYTLGVIRTLEQQTRDEIQRLGGNVGLERIVDGLHVDGAWSRTFISFRVVKLYSMTRYVSYSLSYSDDKINAMQHSTRTGFTGSTNDHIRTQEITTYRVLPMIPVRVTHSSRLLLKAFIADSPIAASRIYLSAPQVKVSRHEDGWITLFVWPT